MISSLLRSSTRVAAALVQFFRMPVPLKQDRAVFVEQFSERNSRFAAQNLPKRASHLTLQQQGPVGERLSHFRSLGTKRLLEDRQRPLVEKLCLGDVALSLLWRSSGRATGCLSGVA